MELTAIENLSFAELKAKRGELVEALGGGELASRYVQARTDAKHFDANSARLAARVDALGHDVLAWQKRVADLEAAAKDMRATFDAALATLKQQHADEVSAKEKGFAQAQQLGKELIAGLSGELHDSKARIAELEGKLSQFRALAGA